MTKTFLKSVLEVPSLSKKEQCMKSFILDFAIKNNITYKEDSYGNIYLFKGVLKQGEFRPCVVAHMDTVQTAQEYFITKKQKLQVIESINDYGNIFILDNLLPMGIGGDDKAGVAIALDIISQKDKIMGAFFVEEEIGCRGAKNLDINMFNDVAYVMEFDAPSDNWISRVSWGVHLFNDCFYGKIKPLLKKYRQTRINYDDPFTDIQEIKKKIPVNCINIFAGYQKQHTNFEFVVIEHAQKAAHLGIDLIDVLGNNISRYEYNPEQKHFLLDNEKFGSKSA